MKTKFTGFLTLLLALVVQISFAQQKEVSGTVTSDKGLPLPGVSITVVGTDNGTRTDFDGNFSIQVQPDATLKFSYVGEFERDRKSTRLNSSHVSISYAVFCLKKKTEGRALRDDC